MEREFPDCFPENFKTKILPQEAKEQDLQQVYRISKTGTIDENTFISTFEEVQKGIRPHCKTDDLNDPSFYSTSCCLSFERASYLLNLIMRHVPSPKILKRRYHGQRWR